MSQEQARQFVEQGAHSFASGQPAHALEMADQALALNPHDSDALTLRGVCLALLNRPQEATEAFRRAIDANPHNAKAYYNFAIHLNSQGDRAKALELAERAMAIDPRLSVARDLATKISEETGLQRSSTDQPDVELPPTTAAASPMVTPPVVPGGEPADSTPHLPWITALGPKWRMIGWTLAVLSLVWFIATIVVGLPEARRALEQNASRAPRAPESTAVTVLFWTTYLLSLLYVVLDVVNRRRSPLWVLPAVACCCAQWLVLPAYLSLNKN